MLEEDLDAVARADLGRLGDALDQPSSPATARRTFSAVLSAPCSGWYPPGTKRVTIPPSAQIPRLVFTLVSPFVRGGR